MLTPLISPQHGHLFFSPPVIVNYDQESNLNNLKIMIIHAAQSMCHFIRSAALLFNYFARIFVFISGGAKQNRQKKLP